MTTQRPVRRHVPAPRKHAVYTVPRFADEIGISERTVWRLIAAQKIRTVALSIGRVGIPASELERIATRGI